ncbi:MAG TPA: hypothetical protein VGN13_05555 [Solirubrobacteraceae bacterium]|jgi:hypothetical protein
MPEAKRTRQLRYFVQNGDWAPIAGFFYARDALDYVARTRVRYTVRDRAGRVVTGTTSHGAAILDVLERAGEGEEKADG